LNVGEGQLEKEKESYLSENKAAIHEALLDLNKELKVTTKEEDAQIKKEEE